MANGASVNGPKLRLCALHADIDATSALSAEGLGCGAGLGAGAGGATPAGIGGGGGHGGLGGAGGAPHNSSVTGLSISAVAPGGKPYDDPARPRMVGSGGGPTASGGAGGGIVWVNVINATLDGSINAGGLSGVGGPNPALLGGGGGAGGSALL